MRLLESPTGRWWRRSAPPRGVLARATLAATLASLGRVGLLAGSISLLVDAARRPAWLAIAVSLTAIEIVAFVRSPLQFLDRLSGHRVGFAAVEHWRRWLVERTTTWPVSRWRRYSTGDLLQRFLTDTDTLQDLWLRAALPLVATGLTALLADLVVSLLAPKSTWLLVGLALLVWHALTLSTGLATLTRGQRLEQNVRDEAARAGARGVSLARAARELVSLGAGDDLTRALEPALNALARAREALDTFYRRQALLVGLLGALAPLVLLLLHPRGSGLEYAVALSITLALAGELSGVPNALRAVLAVSGVAERLDEIDSPAPVGSVSASGPSRVEANLTWHVGEREAHVSFALSPGQRLAITGPSGSGKSRLLHVLAGLDEYGGTLRLAGVEMRELREEDRASRLAYLPPEPSVLEGYVRDVVGLSRDVGPLEEERLAALGLPLEANDRLSGLSRGERARVALVRALLGTPDVVLLDEPTSALGDAETSRVIDLLATTRATLVIATHDARVMEFCDDVIDLTSFKSSARLDDSNP